MNRKKNTIIGYQLGDLIAGLIGLVFSAGSILILLEDSTEPPAWFALIFFGLTAVVLLSKYLNPKNRFIGWNSEEAKKIKEEEFEYIFTTEGVFEYHVNHFEVYADDKQMKCYWDSILKITAFKIDQLTTDEICLLIEYGEDGVLQISESTLGWFRFLEELKTRLPTIDQSWEIEIINPAFDRKETIIYASPQK